MAQVNAQVRCRLAFYARWLLVIAGTLAKYTPVRIPHRAVLAVCNRSWSMQVGDGPWFPIRIDNQGRRIA